jgi:hypothetical protein
MEKQVKTAINADPDPDFTDFRASGPVTNSEDNFVKVNNDRIEDLKGQKLSSSASFFTKHSYRDGMRHKCHFCLAFCSVFTVVWSMLVINSVIEKGPIIFL